MNKFQAFISLGLAGASLVGYAQPVSSLNNEFRAYIGLQGIDYVELDEFGVTPDGVLDGEKGHQPLLGLTWSRQPQNGLLAGLFTQVDLRLADGKTDYTGYLQNLQTGALTPYKQRGVKAVTYDLGVKVGIPLTLDQGFAQVVPYGYLGHHHWVRDSSSSVYGYREDYFHNTIGFGVKVQSMLSRVWALEADLLIGRTQDAKMNLKLTGKNYPLSSRDLTRFEVAAIQRLSPTLALRYGYEVTNFKYGRSPVVDGFLEPSSKTALDALSIGMSILY